MTRVVRDLRSERWVGRVIDLNAGKGCAIATISRVQKCVLRTRLEWTSRKSHHQLSVKCGCSLNVDAAVSSWRHRDGCVGAETKRYVTGDRNGLLGSNGPLHGCRHGIDDNAAPCHAP